MTNTTVPKLPPQAFPSYVVSDADRARWEVAHALMEGAECRRPRRASRLTNRGGSRPPD